LFGASLDLGDALAVPALTADDLAIAARHGRAHAGCRLAGNVDRLASDARGLCTRRDGRGDVLLLRRLYRGIRRRAHAVTTNWTRAHVRCADCVGIDCDPAASS